VGGAGKPHRHGALREASVTESNVTGRLLPRRLGLDAGDEVWGIHEVVKELMPGLRRDACGLDHVPEHFDAVVGPPHRRRRSRAPIPESAGSYVKLLEPVCRIRGDFP
jgi:hypothetical protein